MAYDESNLYNVESHYEGTRCSLYDLAAWKNGLAFKAKDTSRTGRPVIKIAELNNGITANTSYTENQYSKEVLVSWGDLLFSWSGNPQTSIDVFRYRLQDGWLNQHIFKVTPNNELVTKEYLFYVLKYLKQRFTQIASNKQTTGLGHITVSDLKRINLTIPSKNIQSRIASALGMLDSKIEVNSAINDNLTEMARSVFKSWFIDFEPFGNIAPQDWRQSTLGQIAIMSTDSWSPTKEPNMTVEHYSIPAFDERCYPLFETASDIKSNKYIITPDSVMISKLNPATKRIWRPMCITKHCVCSTEFIVYQARKHEQRDFIYSILDSAPFLNHLCSHVTGTTNSRQRAAPKATLEFPIILPPDHIVEEFCSIVTPIYNSIASNIIENQSLATIRDSLLPKLMSGEIDNLIP